MKPEEVTIIGAGPAGLATALQLKRLGVDPLVLERARIGGLLRNANLVENYPGFPTGISGPELVRLFEEQARRASVQVTGGEVVELCYAQNVFLVRTRQRSFQSRVVVIATGTRPVTFSDGEVPAPLLGRVVYEIDSLWQTAGRHIVIVGAGDAAFDYALNLARRNHVAVLNRSDQIKCLPVLWERAKADARIAYHPRTTISRIAQESNGDLWLECAAAAGQTRLRADYVIGALGREPQLGFLSAGLAERVEALEAQGVLHRIGDVKNGRFRQTAIAVGDGILAAMKIHRHLKETS